MINNILKVDPSFNEGMFITKVNNIFIMLHSAIMMDNLDRVRHYISNELEEKYDAILKDLRERNRRQMYDELNVKTTTIKSVDIAENEITVKIDIVSRYMDYLVDKDTGKFISGINDHRVEKINHLVFTKRIGSLYSGIDKKCPGCGANIDVNNSGKCDYCGAIFNTENYDWILSSIIIDE